MKLTRRDILQRVAGGAAGAAALFGGMRFELRPNKLYAADTKITDLTALDPFVNTAEIPLNSSATDKKVTGTVLRAWVGNIERKISTAAQSPAAGATTYLTDSNISVPVGKLRAGTAFRWTIFFSKTAAGTAARSHLIKVGTAGTTADATIATLTSGTPSAAADQGYQVITFTIRTIGASATSHGALMAIHQLSTTGLFANETEVLLVGGTAFDSTVANLIVGLAVTSGASEALTYEQIIAEAFNL